ncbi:MAG: Beta-N-acetylhexosaminidase Beta-lactamase [Acidobacteria bacterium]|nr:Beta-N-acetylhexosaminidase Beta-lactamase [Acidobacteriota bacterium]
MKIQARLAALILPFLWFQLSGQRAFTASSIRTEKASAYEFCEPDQAWVANTLQNLSLRDKIAQLIYVRMQGRFINREDPEFVALAREVTEAHVGGVVLFSGNVYESAELLNDLQSISKLPLIVASDFERGASFRIADTTSFPWTMAIGATGSEEFAYQEGKITAQEARAMGVHWIFAPALDVNSNPDNPVINIRSFGEDPELVARLGTAFIKGARSQGVLTTAKHFPGHGDTATDSHIGLPLITADMERLEAVELVPFKSAISAGVDAIMTAHIAVPRLTGDPLMPATLSSRILGDLLRKSLGFDGLVVTDALEMGAITNRYWSGLVAVKALQAGADALLLPLDVNVAINEVERAVRRGDLSESEIDRSVERILTAKSRLGLHHKRAVPIENIGEIISNPENHEIAQTIADHSITLVKDERHLLPINPINPPSVFSLVLASDMDSAPASVFQTRLRRRFPDIQTESFDTRAPENLISRAYRRAITADIIILSTVVRIASGKASLAIPDNQKALLEKLAAVRKPIIWVAFGNPYVLQLAPKIGTYLCVFSYADVSQIAAAKAISGEIATTGKMPVSIPKHCKVGAGIQTPALDMTLKNASPEAVGLAPSAFTAAKKQLEASITESVFPGASLLVGYRKAVVLDASAGSIAGTAGPQPAGGETIYGLHSLSETIGPITAAMMLTDSAQLILDEAVRDYLPEFQGTNKDQVRVIDLLSQSAGVSGSIPPVNEDLPYEKIFAALCATPLSFAPGRQREYSPLGELMIREIVTRAAGMPLISYLAQKLFEPLGMKSTAFRESSGYPIWAAGKAWAPAELFSSTRDLALFAQMLLNRGIYDHRRFLSSEIIERFTSNQGLAKNPQGLGWTKPSRSGWTSKTLSPSAFGINSRSGNFMWIDPKNGFFVIFLTSGTNPGVEQSRIESVHSTIIEAVSSELKRSHAQR